jgi:hypothetical protein
MFILLKESANSETGLKLNDKGTTQIIIFNGQSVDPVAPFDINDINVASINVRAFNNPATPCDGAPATQTNDKKDYNDDGIKDLLIKVETSKMCLTLSTTQIILIGALNDGAEFEFIEDVVVLP